MLRIPSNAGDSSAYKLKKSVETLLLALAKRYFSTKYSIFLNAECFFFLLKYYFCPQKSFFFHQEVIPSWDKDRHYNTHAWSWSTKDASCSSELTVLVVAFRTRKGCLPCVGKVKRQQPGPACLLPESSQLLRVRGIRNRYTISMYYFFPSKELTGKQIRDSSHSPFSHLVI